MTTTSTGATYFTMTDHAFAILKGVEMRTSSIIVFGLMIQPTNTQVKSATIGMITELEMKSAKSSSEEPSPNGWMNESTL